MPDCPRLDLVVGSRVVYHVRTGNHGGITTPTGDMPTPSLTVATTVLLAVTITVTVTVVATVSVLHQGKGTKIVIVPVVAPTELTAPRAPGHCCWLSCRRRAAPGR